MSPCIPKIAPAQEQGDILYSSFIPFVFLNQLQNLLLLPSRQLSCFIKFYYIIKIIFFNFHYNTSAREIKSLAKVL